MRHTHRDPVTGRFTKRPLTRWQRITSALRRTMVAEHTPRYSDLVQF